jgi:16S rRNA (cytosine1402-N4)-methyltransferase
MSALAAKPAVDTAANGETPAAPAARFHTPVLLAETLAVLNPQPGETVCDVTLGMGGHSEALATRVTEAGAIGRLVAFDRDPNARALAGARLAPFGAAVTIIDAPFSQLGSRLHAQGVEQVDGLLADLGVSSLQLDAIERGFSYRAPGPVDMRMDPTVGLTALELVASLDEDGLTTLLRELGEVHEPRRVARAIKSAELSGELTSTTALAHVVKRVTRGPRSHPAATLVFQALRMAVNNELGELDALLAQVPHVLAPGGRAAIIAFHSLEDRRVKQAFKALVETGDYEPLTTKAVTAGEAELAANPRAHSARLRAVRRRAANEPRVVHGRHVNKYAPHKAVLSVGPDGTARAAGGEPLTGEA